MGSPRVPITDAVPQAEGAVDQQPIRHKEQSSDRQKGDEGPGAHRRDRAAERAGYGVAHFPADLGIGAGADQRGADYKGQKDETHANRTLPWHLCGLVKGAANQPETHARRDQRYAPDADAKEGFQRIDPGAGQRATALGNQAQEREDRNQYEDRTDHFGARNDAEEIRQRIAAAFLLLLPFGFRHDKS